jgi:hypothetical protein
VKNLLLLGTSAALLLAGCGGDPTADILATNPAGNHGGTAWTMTEATVTNNGTQLSVHMFAEDVSDCDAFPPSGSSVGYITFSMPAELGPRELYFDLFALGDPDIQTVTFVTPPSSNTIATEGILNVTALDDSSVTLGMMVDGGDGYDVNGTFTATFCP